MSRLLIGVLSSSKIDSDLYKSIHDNEKDIFERIISGRNNIDRLHHIRYDKNKIDELINSYNILKGEIMVGNDNPDIIKQLKRTILSLVNVNVIKLKDIIPVLEYLFMLT